MGLRKKKLNGLNHRFIWHNLKIISLLVHLYKYAFVIYKTITDFYKSSSQCKSVVPRTR